VGWIADCLALECVPGQVLSSHWKMAHKRVCCWLLPSLEEVGRDLHDGGLLSLPCRAVLCYAMLANGVTALHVEMVSEVQL
jgi:hypothetical protein